MRTFLIKSTMILYTIISLVSFTSCSDDDDVELISATGITINPSTLSLVQGEEYTLIATVTPMNVINKAVIWSSSNNTVARVSASGVLTSLKAGQTSIIVTTEDESKADTCVVTITSKIIPVVGITIAPSTLNLVEGGQTGTLATTFIPANATNKNVSWSSNDETIAMVDSFGVVTPIKIGKATVIVTTEDGVKADSCVVDVTLKIISVVGITIDPSTLSLVEGGLTDTIVATIAPADATNKHVRWSSNNETVATVDTSGVITPLKAGETTITVTTKDGSKRATCNVTVAKSYAVGLSGNGYVTKERSGARITDNGLGLHNWRNSESVISTYFYLHKAGSFELALEAKGKSEINASCGDKTYKVKIDSDDFSRVNIGKFTVEKPGYVCVDLQGIVAESGNFGQVKALLVGVEGEVSYVHDFSDYWGRRGPSVHMPYKLPSKEIEWFYNEVTVPKEGETMHSYYMANGFGEGYFGMQYNSDTERRILFSVWSPYVTDKPEDIPEEYKIILKRQGRDVHIGEFGNEGSGGQSYLRYNWKAGVTYKFLMQVHPDDKGNTVYTAYFFATDDKEWRLIASFLRPKTDTWYKGAHSFLENFSPEQGYLSREVSFSNQWAHSSNGEWIRLDEAHFTHDATASAGVRLDYQGGILDNGSFYLKMGGFFNESTKAYTPFKSNNKGIQPDVDLKSLEKIK